MSKKTINKICYVLVLIGGINWGAIGLLKVNLVVAAFNDSVLVDIIYILVGISASFLLYELLSKSRKK